MTLASNTPLQQNILVSLQGGSHVSKRISILGNFQNIFTVHYTKKCTRILFGDRDAFFEKFRTCAKARPFGSQALSQSFYQKEHTKPLFKKHGILSIQNLYTYHCFMEIFKILKLRVPMALFSEYIHYHSAKSPHSLHHSHLITSFTNQLTSGTLFNHN